MNWAVFLFSIFSEAFLTIWDFQSAIDGKTMNFVLIEKQNSITGKIISEVEKWLKV